MTPLEKIAVYEMFRNRIVEEDALINHRMSWMLWCQAILLGAWAVLITHDFGPNSDKTAAFAKLMIILIAGSGAAAAIVSKISVHAAQEEIGALVIKYKEQYKELSTDVTIPELTGDKKRHDAGHQMPNWMPVGFIILQIFIALISFFS